MSYVKRNVGGQWKTIQVSPEDERRIKKATFDENVAILKKIKSDPSTEGFSMSEILAIFGTVARHYHYNVEEFVDMKIENKII